jgi:hypothetical protein
VAGVVSCSVADRQAREAAMRVDSGRRPALAGMRKKGVLNRGAAQQPIEEVVSRG